MAKPKKIIIIGFSALIIYLLMSSKSSAFSKPTASGKIRGCDPFGCGIFGAKRGDHIHQGEDFSISAGEKVLSPISGKITRIAYPYGSDMNYKGVEIVNSEYSAKIFYMTLTVPVGTTVKAGDVIGVAQNISAKYGASMVNHIHLEMRDKSGKLIQPSKLI